MWPCISKYLDINARSGIYFLRTSPEAKTEDFLWLCHNTIREIEATFRVLKNDGPTAIIAQNSVTILAQNEHGQVINICKCSEPDQNVIRIYDALKYKHAPFTMKKSEVHKPESPEGQHAEKQTYFFRLAAIWVKKFLCIWILCL